jgi:predicted RNA-binding Zn ribbon-like protein
MVEMTQQIPAFDKTSGNWLCLDFTHTLDDRYSDHPKELLGSYPDLVSWSQYVHILKDEQAQRLFEGAASRPAEASAALKRAIDVREVIYRVFLAIAEGVAPEEVDLTALNAALAEALSHACIVSRDGSFVLDWAGKEDALDVILWEAVRSAADLLTAEELSAVRACAAEDCKWLFLDTSKNRSRRWCDMKTCGNRYKAHRHYERKKQA